MNLLDLLLVIALVSAAMGGYRLGLIARGLSWLGVLGGFALANWTVPFALGFVTDGTAFTRLLVTLAVMLGTVGLASTALESVGLRVRKVVARGPLGPIDRVGGGLAGAVGVLVLVWLLLPTTSQIPGIVARQVRSSSVVGFVRESAPPPPDAMQALRRLVDQSRFPDVFSNFGPSPEVGPPPEQIPVDQATVELATASTVNVESYGCGARYEGSGWAVAENTIVTNAHVVAGADRVQVRRPDGRVIDAVVVAFDHKTDLALLDVAGLGQAPLAYERAALDDGVAIIGYPGGQNTPRVAPGIVKDRRKAIGRDIYDSNVSERDILVMAASLRQGDSGSAVINAAGAVVGVTFAVAADNSSTAYALDTTEVDEILTAPRRPGDAGRCVSK